LDELFGASWLQMERSSSGRRWLVALKAIVDALPESEVEVAISFLAGLGEQEVLDAEIRCVVFRPAAVSFRHGSMHHSFVSRQQATAMSSPSTQRPSRRTAASF